MQEQNKFKYIYNNEEVSREDFEKLAGDSFKWFSEQGIESVPFSSFDSFFNGKYRSGRQINDHLDSVLNVYQNKVTEDIINKSKCSPQCYCDGSCKKPQEKKLGGYNKPTIKGSSTRHKSQAGETHAENLVYVKEGTGYDYLKRRMKDDVITNSSRGEKETMKALDNLRNTLNKSPIEIIKEAQEEKQGIKESNGKTDYSEINLEILDLMAERFTANKHKYPKGNMKKPIDIKSLEWALFRHVKKMIQPIETDEETYKDHLSAVLCNCSMLYDQLKVK